VVVLCQSQLVGQHGVSACRKWGVQVMPFVGGGALQQILRSKFPSGMEEELVVSIARDVLHGLDYLHHHSCMHRDLKVSTLPCGLGVHDMHLSYRLSPCCSLHHPLAIRALAQTLL
jgi:serine/threonine protein kinase